MLIYIGQGAFQPPYPARDLTSEEVKEFGEAKLLATGLYEKTSSAREDILVMDVAEKKAKEK